MVTGTGRGNDAVDQVMATGTGRGMVTGMVTGTGRDGTLMVTKTGRGNDEGDQALGGTSDQVTR